MKTTLRIAIVLFVLLSFVSNVFAVGNSAEGSATAKLQTGITVTKKDGAASSNLRFGTLIAGAGAGGTVKVSYSSGNPVIEFTSQGSLTRITDATGNGIGPAIFTVSGTANANFSLTLPASDITITQQSGGSSTMTVGTFTAYSSTSTTSLDANGANELYIGALLHVTGGQSTGFYVGTFEITIVNN